MNPPLRGKEHYDRLWTAIKNDIVDVLGSDHAPHLKANKNKEYPNTLRACQECKQFFQL